MTYDLMLLADPGTDRARVLEIMRTTPELTADPMLEDRFWLKAPNAAAQINIGTKDPVESVHVTFDFGGDDAMEAVVRHALSLASRLEMYVEDVQWGHEVTAENLTGLRAYWQSLRNRPSHLDTGKKPWWKVW